MRARWSSVFFGVGLVCLAVACHAAVSRTGGAALPPPTALFGAALVLACGLTAASRGWVALLAGAAPGSDLAHGFMLSQLGKYIPGGVWLGVGQIGLAVGTGVPAHQAAGALAAFGIAFAVSAATLAGAAAALTDTTSAYAAAALLGLAAPVLLHRRWLSGLAERVARRFRSRPGQPAIPTQRRILAAAGWSFGSVCCSALAFALLLHSLDQTTAPVETAAAFAIAWLAGYLVLGLPSGIGAREAVLIALLPAPAGAVLAASLAQRIVQMIVEAVLAGALRFIASRSLSVEVPHA